MSLPDSEWTTAINDIRDQVEELCSCLRQAPLEDRLQAVATLNNTFAGLNDRALREAVIAARAEGWALRRIAAAVDCSHEQVRLLTT
ncbi:MAG: hypothetical protein JWL99_6441 [Streptomyces oryziradicis]|uniref:Uncharacterized protein n=1 Tax=Actinacidiphila oryziradicis TaxID=2571141 RepID=A0A4U0SPP7_9ACTN|nr:hypothetical protein [Actinacidiphila oryziradicis]MCW2875121.1 hypothetical protein [Actinacidiphila oryziradicis]MDX6328802.1 hypothetical protein [Streptomycetaceae bacterium]TKA10161.1 hypothetical protein FCI23_18320 [Actinacidiphila oryziradicis]